MRKRNSNNIFENPTATYTQGRLIAANLTPRQFEDYINGKLKGKALKQALSKPGTSVPTTSNFSIKAGHQETLPGGLPLYEGYIQNELGLGELVDLVSLADYLESEPIASVADKTIAMPSTWSDIAPAAKDIAERYATGVLKVDKIGDVILNAKGVKDSMNHFMKNKNTSVEHKQRACDALVLVPDVLQNGRLFEYGLEQDGRITSYLVASPVAVGDKQCIMVVRVRKAPGQNGRFYLHGVDLLEQVKEKSRMESHHWGAGLVTGKPDRADPRDVFRVIRKAFAVKYNYANDTENQITATSAESADLFTDGVLEAQNAIVTQPDANFSIKALHASPHNFRKFSTDKMGTGEGAQAYGWGLYFATNPITNKIYLNQFNHYVEGWKVGDKIVDEYDFKQMIKKAGIDDSDIPRAYARFSRIDEGIAEMQSRIAKAKESKLLDQNNNLIVNNIDKAERVIRALRYLKENNIFATGGINYRVDLNVDDSNLLMWDEPVSRELHVLAHKDIILGNYEEVKDVIASGPTLSGKKLYKEIAGVLGSKKESSEWLAAHGYKGIKYLDGNSRSAGEGTYNYVIFSGDDIKITAVNETGIWSMDEGWEEYTDPTATFSIKPAAADTLDRFTVDPLGERIVHTVRTEARRYARVLGDKTPQEQAMNAIASAESIIMAVDKYLHRPDKPVSRRHRNQLTKLRSIIEKYAQIIASGTPRSFKRISPAEQQELEAAIAELEAAELDTATTESDQILTDSDRLTKREAAARQKEHQIFTKPSVRRRSAALTTRARMWYDAEQSIWTWTSSNLPPANSRYSRARRNAMPSSAALCATTTSSTTPRLSRKSQMPSMISSTGK